MTNRRLPGVIIAHARTGTTFLTSCLSVHPQIFCPRGEPLGFGWGWRARLFTEASDVEILQFVLGMLLYDTCVCKIIYEQATDAVMKYIEQHDVRIIHLIREDLLKLTASHILTEKSHQGELSGREIHTYGESEPVCIEVDVPYFVNRARELKKVQSEWEERLGAYKHVLRLTYLEMIGGRDEDVCTMPQNIADRLCDFLEVDRLPMHPVGLLRTNPYPLSTLFSNWDDLRQALISAQLLEEKP